ncbi:MAG: glycosyltransferase [Planctomycetes bacterium]|nr:glycosyltransferase [Planctomycetota bacterium]
MGTIGVVVIGRNEGERLRRCLESLRGRAAQIVYVDSGSTDGSVEAARGLGADVVALDLGRPFTAARARNAGFERLRALEPAVDLVQFVDGDCEVAPDWLPRAASELAARAECAAVFGRRRERAPESSRFNRLCDMEWNTPVGEAEACGGDFLVRAAAFTAAGRFNEDMIAGEEPELCVRIRKLGWKLLRIDAEMTLHDAALHRFSQWWRRAERAGHAYAEGAAVHGAPPIRHNARDVRSLILWGAWLPALALGGAVAAYWSRWCSFLPAAIAALYALQFLRIYARRRRSGDSARDAALCARYTLLAKIPLFLGAWSYWRHRARGLKRPLIEYR